MGQLHGRVRDVPMLAPLARAPAGFPLQVAFTQTNLGFRRFAEYGDGHGGCVAASSLLGGRDALPTVSSCLVGEDLLDVLAGDAGDQDAWTVIDDFGVKAPSGRSAWRRR